MNAISVDSRGYAAQDGAWFPKRVAMAVILAGALAVAGLGAYWLATVPPAAVESGRATEPVRPVSGATPAPAAAEPLLKAPAATCVDGRPASADLPADACS